MYSQKKNQYWVNQKSRSMYSILMLITCCDQKSERSEMNRPIDTNMLMLAMARLKIPHNFIKLILQLFSDRTNSVITAFGNTDLYEVQIGIDQGEVISPLLWTIYIDPLLTVLNETNIAPYQISSDPSIPGSSISTIGYMDDTNLISSSINGLTYMLRTAQEFYDLNNTKINFNKAILICNRDPFNPTSPLPPSLSPYRFDLLSTAFELTPLKLNESFRFLGVWFTLSLSKQFVKKQATTKYNLFAHKLKNKCLTSDHLTYLHNMVLIPRLDFRLKATVFSESECYHISAPFKRIYKHSFKLTISLPNAFLHYNKALGLVNLYQRHLTNHITHLSNILHNDQLDTVKNIIFHRLYNIQIDINIPHSPLYIDNFNAFTKTKCFKTDYILHLFFFNQLNIGFARPLPASNHVKYHHTPIYSLFYTESQLYAKSLHLFKKHDILYLSDCIDDDCFSIMPFHKFIERNSTHHLSHIIPKWYHHIVVSTIHDNSIQLEDHFVSKQQLANHQPSLSVLTPSFDHITIPRKIYNSSYWYASWDAIHDFPIFGRLLKNSLTQITIQHWICSIDYSFSSKHTPNSQQLTLVKCQGCDLNDLNAKSARKGHQPDKRLTNLPCLFTDSYHN
jgi:hypothetical protein